MPWAVLGICCVQMFSALVWLYDMKESTNPPFHLDQSL